MRGQSVLAASAAVAWSAAISAWSRYARGGRPVARAAARLSSPAAIRARSQRLRSCSSRVRSSPAESTRASRRACWSSSSARRLRTSSSPGSSSATRSARWSASSERSSRKQGSVVGGCVALVEDEVDHGQHARRPLVEPVRLGHAEADAGVRDLGPRPKQALSHRRLADEEGSCDLLGREPRDGLQRERDPPRHRQGRVAAGEEQAELVVVPRLSRDGRDAAAPSASASSSRSLSCSIRRRLSTSSAR